METTEEVKEVEKISNVYNLNQICRVKGKQGLWAMITEKNKSGMIGFSNLETEKRIFAHIGNVEALGSYEIITLSGSNLSVGDVLDNMFDLMSSDESFDDKDIMGKVAPNYDPDWFKEHHYKKILKWFNIFWTVLNKEESK